MHAALRFLGMILRCSILSICSSEPHESCLPCKYLSYKLPYVIRETTARSRKGVADLLSFFCCFLAAEMLTGPLGELWDC